MIAREMFHALLAQARRIRCDRQGGETFRRGVESNQGMEAFWLIPISVIVGGIVYAIVKEQGSARVREMQVRERIAMIEKGLIPPPEKDPRGFERAMSAVDREERRDSYGERSYRSRRRPRAARHRSSGITLMGIGFGLMFMIGVAVGDPPRGIGIGGFVVLFGFALLVNSLFERREERADGTPPNAVVARTDVPRHD
jgi:hypothetical protein